MRFRIHLLYEKEIAPLRFLFRQYARSTSVGPPGRDDFRASVWYLLKGTRNYPSHLPINFLLRPYICVTFVTSAPAIESHSVHLFISSSLPCKMETFSPSEQARASSLNVLYSRLKLERADRRHVGRDLDRASEWQRNVVGEERLIYVHCSRHSEQFCRDGCTSRRIRCLSLLTWSSLILPRVSRSSGLTRSIINAKIFTSNDCPTFQSREIL